MNCTRCPRKAVLDLFDGLCAVCSARADPSNPLNKERIESMVGWELSPFLVTKEMYARALKRAFAESGIPWEEK